MPSFNPLIGCPSPRDMPEFYHFFSKVKRFDKYQVKYCYEINAYTRIRDYFLGHREYTHLVLWPDDLLATNDDLDILISDIKEYDFPTISGICNLTYIQQDLVSACPTLPGITIDKYDFFKREQIEAWVREKKYIHEVGFEGFALCFIRRDVLQNIWFRGQFGLDRTFAKDCIQAKIPMRIDIRADCFHMKWRLGDSKVYEKFGVGSKTPGTIFIPKIR